MQILLSCAKDMTAVCDVVSDVSSVPAFSEVAMENARIMSEYTPEELEALLKVSPSIAYENYERYRQMVAGCAAEGQAVFSYTGMAYRHLKPSLWSEDDALFANAHLWITSFLYGLLRPMDMIHLYRLEGAVRLREGCTMFDFWKPLLTDMLINSVKEDDGILVHLATEEMTRLFDWKTVCREVRVVEPRFVVRAGERTKVVTVHAKMCRGAMANEIIKSRISSVDDLKAFLYDGYSFSGNDGDVLTFTRESAV